MMLKSTSHMQDSGDKVVAFSQILKVQEQMCSQYHRVPISQVSQKVINKLNEIVKQQYPGYRYKIIKTYLKQTSASVVSLLFQISISQGRTWRYEFVQMDSSADDLQQPIA